LLGSALFGAVGFYTAVAIWMPRDPSLYAVARTIGGRLVGFDRAQLFGPIAAPLPQAEFEEYTTDSGLVLNRPTDRRIWRAPLLSTPHPTPGLSLRDRTDLSKGFRMAGAWEPLDFPDYRSTFLGAWREYRANHPSGR
jgi:hypothetical protein